jgi:tRNA nucleotidyltransferase (CCA-adding enzyme)
VVEPSSGEIIGIVTRTDLLKTLAPKPVLPGEMNLASRLEAVLPDDRLSLLKAIAQAAHKLGSALYIVGGFVRDLLLEQPSLDFDLVVEGDAIALAHALARKYGGRVTSHTRFGTSKWHLDSPASTGRPCSISVAGLHSVDLVTARTEFYSHPTALPTVERGSIKLDLHRRDFTINTLALRLDGRHYGELHDYWGGLDDLRSGLVRVLHSLSFVDDPTRILRAARFEQRFGFRIEARTLQLLLEARSLIERLSGDRIRHELNHILATEAVSRILQRLQEFDLLAAIHSLLTWDAWLDERLVALDNLAPGIEWGLTQNPRLLRIDLGYTLWLIRLSPDQAGRVSSRLKLPVSLSRVIQAACELWHDRQTLTDASVSAVVTRLDALPPLARYALYQAAADDERMQFILSEYVNKWWKVQPTIDGHALRALGLSPGPSYRQILETLRNAWLDGEITTKDEERALLEKLVHVSSIR